MVGWHHLIDGHEFEHFLELVVDREVLHAVVLGSQKVGHD